MPPFRAAGTWFPFSFSSSWLWSRHHRVRRETKETSYGVGVFLAWYSLQIQTQSLTIRMNTRIHRLMNAWIIHATMAKVMNTQNPIGPEFNARLSNMTNIPILIHGMSICTRSFLPNIEGTSR